MLVFCEVLFCANFLCCVYYCFFVVVLVVLLSKIKLFGLGLSSDFLVFYFFFFRLINGLQ